MATTYQAELDRETTEGLRRRIAYHEAGHATVALMLMPQNIMSAELGDMCGQVNFKVELETVQDLGAFELYDAAQTCAGLLGELLSCGYYDERASAHDMLSLYQIIGHVAVEAYRRSTGIHRPEVFEPAIRARASDLIKLGEELAENILRREQQLLHAIAGALLLESRLGREALLKLKQQFATS